MCDSSKIQQHRVYASFDASSSCHLSYCPNSERSTNDRFWTTKENKFQLEETINIIEKAFRNSSYKWGKQGDEFYDNLFREVYSERSINYTYARYFNKETCTGWLRKNPKRIAVEKWVCRPKDYNKDTKIISTHDLYSWFVSSSQP